MKKAKLIITILLYIVTQPSTAQQLKLFNEDIRGLSRTNRIIVMDFIENYFTSLLKKGKQDRLRQMADDKVYFRLGSPENLRELADTMSVNISLTDKHFYEVSWKKDDTPFVTIVFPAQFDLIFGIRQDEAQARLKDDICTAKQNAAIIQEPTALKEKEKDIYVSGGRHFKFESLNDAKYYNKDGNKYSPFFSTRNKEYSAANLFQGLIPANEYRLYIDQTIYGMKSKSYTIMLSQWLNYCDKMELEIYFAIEEEREDGLLTIVLAHSKEFGFNHMLSVVIPDNFINNPNSILKARLTSYIPTYNLKNLYQKQSKIHERVKWQ